jgi:hypothetical protein
MKIFFTLLKTFKNSSQDTEKYYVAGFKTNMDKIMSQNEKNISVRMQPLMSPSVTIYKELIHNQSIELGFDTKNFWIDNALIKTYDYIRMFSHNRGVLPSSRQMSKP